MKIETIQVKFNTGELDRQENTSNRKKDRKRKNMIHIIATGLLITLLVFTLAMVNSPEETNASNGQINSEYAYYGVDNFRDYSRAIRKETCYRALTEALEDVTEKQVIHCATSETLITAIESANMNSRRCVEDNNCMWLKGWQNGRYGFMKFKTQYEWSLYFSKKWAKYHYKKSLHTLVFGYKQPNWEYRYGWTYTQQHTYYAFLRNNYYRVYDEIEKL